MAFEPIRVFVWDQDGKAVADILLEPGQERPPWFFIGLKIYQQDPENGDMYREISIARFLRLPKSV